MTPLLLQVLPMVHLLLGLLLAAWTLAFLLRIVLTWYPQVDLSKGPWPLVAWPTEPVLALTRRDRSDRRRGRDSSDLGRPDQPRA